jgi:hypothetical protein
MIFQRSYAQVALLALMSIGSNVVHTSGPSSVLFAEGSAACTTQGESPRARVLQLLLLLPSLANSLGRGPTRRFITTCRLSFGNLLLLC